MSLSAAYNMPTQSPKVIAMEVAAAGDYYQGALVSYITGGVDHTPAQDQDFAGIAYETLEDAEAGDKIEVMVAGQIGVPNDNFATTDIGTLAYMAVSGTASNSPADIRPESSAGTHDEPIGIIYAYDMDGYTWIDLGIRTIPTDKS